MLSHARNHARILGVMLAGASNSWVRGVRISAWARAEMIGSVAPLRERAVLKPVALMHGRGLTTPSHR